MDEKLEMRQFVLRGEVRKVTNTLPTELNMQKPYRDGLPGCRAVSAANWGAAHWPRRSTTIEHQNSARLRSQSFRGMRTSQAVSPFDVTTVSNGIIPL